MPLKTIRKEIEAEREIGYKYLQLLSRAESLVPGAGREAIEALLWDANAAVIRADVQNDRVVLDGIVNCQAVYRQGDETSLRALSAKANISQVSEIPGAQGGMLCRVHPVVENVDARYENGHMVFMVSLGIHVRVLKLEKIELIEGVEEAENLEMRFEEICLTRLAAEATETAVLSERVELPQSLDARTTLMDWGSVVVDSSEPDLGGVRVKGRVQLETLVASGMEGRPAVLVKYPIEFDKLIELPEWLSQNACVTPSVRSIKTQLEQNPDEEDAILQIQADVHFAIAANLSQCTPALADAYSTAGVQLKIDRKEFSACTEAVCLRTSENVRGTVLLEEGAASVGNVIAVRMQPNIAEVISENGKTRIVGLMEARVLYMPAGTDCPASAGAQLPFEVEIQRELGEAPVILLTVNTAEANALMSDRLEMKVGLGVEAMARIQKSFSIAEEIETGREVPRRSAYIVHWPDGDEDAWAIGRRYGVPLQLVEDESEGKILRGKPLVLRV